MRRAVVAALLSLASVQAVAGNFATCILKHMHGIQNDPAAYAAMRLCMNEYPGGYSGVQQGEGRGFLSYDSGAECAVKKGAGTASRVAGQQIYNACNKLFNEPAPKPGPWEEYARPANNPFDKFDKK